MKKNLLCIILWLLTTNIFAKDVLQPYQFGDFNTIIKKYPNDNLILHYWGSTCAPCITELPAWGKFLKNEKKIRVVFIQVDNAPEIQVQQRIRKAKIDKSEHYTLTSNFDEFIFFEVDRNWHGEIPMTLLISKDGKRQKILGSVDFQEIKKWASNQ